MEMVCTQNAYFHIWYNRAVLQLSCLPIPSCRRVNTVEESQHFHCNRAAEERNEELEVVRIEPHKANEKPFACDGW